MRVTHQTAHRVLVAGSILMFLVAILGAIGEYLGWWDAIGEVLITVGTLGGLVLGAVDFLRGASEQQVDTVQTRLRSMDGKLDKLDTMDSKLDKLDKLDTMEAKLDKLDVIQAELDHQTGAIEHQVEILSEIRDRL